MAQQYQVDIVTKVVGSSKIAQLDKALDQLAQSQKQVQSQAQGVANSLAKLRAAATGTSGAMVKAGAATATAAKGIRATGAAAAQSSALVAGFAQAFTTMLGPLALATAAITAVGKSISIFSERQADVAVLNNGLKNLGLEGTKSLEALQSVADRLGKQTLFDEEQFTKGFALLTSFRSIGVGSYEEVTTAAANMAQVTGQDLNSALLQLSKALEDPARRVTDLSRSGTVFTEQQKAQIKTLQESGDLLGAQSLILEEIEKQYGNAAIEAGSAGFAGAMDSAGESARDLGEAVGVIIVPALEAFLIAITPAVQKLAEFVELVGKVPGLAGGIKGAFGGVAFAAADASQELEYTGIKVDELYLKYQKLAKELEAETLGLDEAVTASEKLTAAADTTTKSFAETASQGGEIVTSVDQILQKSLTQEQVDKQLANLKALQAANTRDLAAAQQQYQAALGTETGDIDRKLAVTQAVLNAEQQINDAKLQQAQADQQAATTQAEREAAAQRVYEITIANAQLQYEATIATAAAEVQKTEAALRHAQVLLQQYRAEVALAQSKGIYNDRQQEAINSATQLVTVAEQNLQAELRIAEAVGTGAAATREKQIEAAKVVLEMVKQTAQQQQTNSAISQGANEMGRLADNAQRAASASQGISGGSAGGGGGGGGGGSRNVSTFSSWTPVYDKYKVDPETGDIVETTDLERRVQLGRQLANARNVQNRFGQAAAQRGRGIYASLRGSGSGSAISTFAEGGYVTGATQAVVGEGGEPEYIIPASKMDSAMQRYGSGMRGSSVIPESANVSVNYNGSTVDMGGTSYINKGDVSGIVSQAVNQTLTTLAKSSKARLSAGLR